MSLFYYKLCHRYYTSGYIAEWHNARIKPRQAAATIYDVEKHHEKDAIEASG
jgi:hypothetical protein